MRELMKAVIDWALNGTDEDEKKRAESSRSNQILLMIGLFGCLTAFLSVLSQFFR